MFIGTIILLVSAIQMSLSTSLPVINKLLEMLPGEFNKLAPSSNIISHYHLFQVPITIILCFFLGTAQYLAFKKQQNLKVFQTLTFLLVVSILLSVLVMFSIGKPVSVGFKFNSSSSLFPHSDTINYLTYFSLLFSLFYALLSNLTYAKKLWFGKIYKAGSSMAHAGFVLLLIGATLSMGKQRVI